jgi:hypothetical protein
MFNECAEVANQSLEAYKKAQTLPMSLTELRTSLFLEHQRWRHFGEPR